MCEVAVSVIVPCYNMEQFLPECLQSIFGQTLKNIEVICVDDGSVDNTGMILDEAAQKDSRLKVIHQENRGVAASRNRGILSASGTYVIFMDPDDFYPDPGILALLYSKATEHHALICGGAFSCYNSDTGCVTRCFMDDMSGYMFSGEGFISYRDYQFDFGYHRFIYDRVFLIERDIFFPPYARFQDPPFFVKAMIAAERFYAVPNVVYRYRVGIQPDVITWSSKKLQDMIQGHLDVLRISAEQNLPELHALTVRRFEADNVLIPVLKDLNEGNERTRDLVCQFNDSVRLDLLPDRMRPKKEKPYVLRELKALEGTVTVKEESRLQGYWHLACSLIRFCKKRGIRLTLLQVREILEN